MFPVESLSATYIEARLCEQKQQQQTLLQAAAAKPVAPAQGTVTPALQQPRPTFLGGMFSGFVRGSSASPSPFVSRSGTPAATPLPSPSKVPTQAEIEAALLAEKKRDADICAMPAWYH